MRTKHLVLAGLILALAVANAAAASKEVVLDPRSGGKDISGVLRLIQGAWTDIDRERYEFCLADTFTFVPHLAVARDFPDRDVSGWNRQSELDLVRRIFNRGSKIDIKIPTRIESRGTPSRNAETWVVGYIIEVQGTVYAGDAALDFVRINKRWYMAAWRDVAETILKGERSPTSGVLRAKFTRTE